MVELIKSGPSHEQDPEKADYYWIPGGGHYPGNGERSQRQFVISIFNYVRNNHPWWNQTVEKGQAR